MIVSSINIPSYAATQTDDVMDKELTTLKNSLKLILNEKDLEKQDKLKRDIKKNKWDYTLTMENVDRTNLKDAEYVELISAYMTAKNYCKENKLAFEYIDDLPLISYEYESFEEVEKVPQKIMTYKEEENYPGVYTEDKYVYVLNDTTVNKYERYLDTEYFLVNGTEEIKLKENTVPYAKVKVNILTPEEIFTYYKIPESEKSTYQKRIKKLTDKTDNSEFYQSLFYKLPSLFNIKDEIDTSNNMEYNKASTQRKVLFEVATSLIGKVPYQWGGKPLMPGYDTKWWTFDENNEQRGLDCSGFVQWVFLTSGYSEDIYKGLISTTSILTSGYNEILMEDLQIGDIGVFEGKTTNHTGIYIGNNKWIHCSSQANSVTISDYNFDRFYSLVEEDEEEPANVNIIDDISEMVYYTIRDNSSRYSAKDAYTLASLIEHEAAGEGLNGWIAVGEVVRNRVLSNLYPNTVEEVIFQEGQFSDVDKIKAIVPSSELIDIATRILRGDISLLNNEEVLYFRNPMTTSNIPATTKQDWGTYKYFTNVGHHAFYTQN